MLVSLCLGVCICMNNCIVCVCVRIAYAQFLGMGLVPSGSVGAWWVWACTSMDLRSGSVPRTLSCHVPLLTTSIPLKSEIWDSRPISNDFFWGGRLFRAAPTAYGTSQTRGQIGAATVGPMPQTQPQPHQIQALSVNYTTAHGNARSLTHGARPKIEPTSSWMLVITAEPQ